MANTPVPKYELELWVNGVQVGDITKLAKNRSFTLTRNASEELNFSLNLKAFEAYCLSLGVAPLAILEDYVTDIRVKRNGNYLFGVQVVDQEFKLDTSGITVDVKATGFLDLLKDRYVTKSYLGVERVAIAQDLIATTQAGDPSNNFGIVLGTSQYSTGLNDTQRNYSDQNVRDAIINLTNLSDGNFDFRFNYDRSFETFGKIGSDRPNTKFIYPYNVTSGTIPRTAANLWNYIIGIGSGFGNEALRTETADGASRANYKTRQKIVTYSDISVLDTLDQNAYGYLQQVKNILLLPKLNVSGVFANLDYLGVGDRIPFAVTGHTMLPINETYRIEQLQVSLDDNDAESVSITVDNYSV
jgi:hypothetical protein